MAYEREGGPLYVAHMLQFHLFNRVLIYIPELSHNALQKAETHKG